MREAGRALALDPKLDGAAELVTRLMLEPPRDKPPEMERMLEADNLETLRRLSKAGALAYCGFFGFLPLIVGGLYFIATAKGRRERVEPIAGPAAQQ